MYIIFIEKFVFVYLVTKHFFVIYNVLAAKTIRSWYNIENVLKIRNEKSY